MKVGVFAVLFSQLPLEKALDYIVETGCEAIEIGTGGYPGDAHCPLDELVADKSKAQAWMKSITDRGLEISALSCHGNAIHPNADHAKKDHETFRKTVELASMLGIQTINTFSGCPGDFPGAKLPNWVTCAWPPDYLEVLKYQWDEVAIPYWKEQNAFLKSKNVRAAFEIHPGFLVYNTDTALRMREACGEQIGVNFDPSHLFWQGVDPVYAIRKLGAANAIFHFHAKDCKIDEINTKTTGVLDTKNYTDELNRSWIFRTIGYGHDAAVWKDIVSTLRKIGYNGALSIEHEDSLMSIDEGFRKAVTFLKECIIKEMPGEAYWA
ncbi:MAG TPA: sugar phosphate isomerase/epimerase [Armatimonadota bacterium]|nr:sugar phosphate isomerase/epimerase [Armatimonadota bacterium]